MIKNFIKKYKNYYLFLTIMLLFLALPNVVLASGGIIEFAIPFDKIINIFTRPVFTIVSIGGIFLLCLYFIMNKENVSGGFKVLLRIVFGICLIAFAATIVNSIFSFSGATI